MERKKLKKVKTHREFNPDMKARIKAKTDKVKDFKEKYHDEIVKGEIGIAAGLLLEVGKKAINKRS